MPDEGREQVHLGNRVVELSKEDAATVREAFTNLSSAYGQSLDQQRREILSTIGTPQWQAPAPAAPATPPGVEVADVDLLFKDKGAWANHLSTSIEARLAQQRIEQAQLVQGAVAAVDQELQRRDTRAKAQELHDSVMEDMIARRGLDDNRRLIQTIYNDQYSNLVHLPLAVAIDHIGAETEKEIARIRGVTPTAEPTAETSPAPPALLRSARRAGAGGAASAPTGPAKSLSDLIRARQAVALGNAA